MRRVSRWRKRSRYEFSLLATEDWPSDRGLGDSDSLIGSLVCLMSLVSPRTLASSRDTSVTEIRGEMNPCCCTHFHPFYGVLYLYSLLPRGT